MIEHRVSGEGMESNGRLTWVRMPWLYGIFLAGGLY